MNPLNTLLAPRKGFTLIGIAAFALVAASLVLTKALDLAPCPLCIFQRMLYLLLGVLVFIAAVWPRLTLWFGGLALLTGGGGLATAAYQSWIQAFPAPSLSCGPGGQNAIERFVEWAGTQVPWLFTAWGECTSKEWEFLGLSIANWSALAFLGFAVWLVLLLRGSISRR